MAPKCPLCGGDFLIYECDLVTRDDDFEFVGRLLMCRDCVAYILWDGESLQVVPRAVIQDMLAAPEWTLDRRGKHALDKRGP